MKNQQYNQETFQTPIHSGFGSRTTAREVLGNRDLKGMIAIVTGGYSGIGTETTRVLAEVGATVILPVRSLEKAKTSVSGLPNIELDVLNLMDPASIDGFAKRFIDSGRPLHILINNAGIMATPLRRDSRGYESQFSTNHLGHFQLAARLLPALKRADGARVVNLSSCGHRFGGVDFNDPNFKFREYDKWKSYGQSKSAVSLFAVELDRLGKSYGVRAFAVHPGGIPETDLGRDLDTAERTTLPKKNENGQLVRNDSSSKYKTTEEGAATSIWCATSGQLDGMGGVYCEDVDISTTVPADFKERWGVWPWAIDRQMAKELWELSEKLTGVTFSI